VLIIVVTLSAFLGSFKFCNSAREGAWWSRILRLDGRTSIAEVPIVTVFSFVIATLTLLRLAELARIAFLTIINSLFACQYIVEATQAELFLK